MYFLLVSFVPMYILVHCHLSCSSNYCHLSCSSYYCHLFSCSSYYSHFHSHVRLFPLSSYVFSTASYSQSFPHPCTTYCTVICTLTHCHFYSHVLPITLSFLFMYFLLTIISTYVLITTLSYYWRTSYSLSFHSHVNLITLSIRFDSYYTAFILMYTLLRYHLILLHCSTHYVLNYHSIQLLIFYSL